MDVNQVVNQMSTIMSVRVLIIIPTKMLTKERNELTMLEIKCKLVKMMIM